MTTYLAVDWEGNTKHFSAYTYSQAYQDACLWAGDNLRSFDAI